MGFNQCENSFLADALRHLEPRYREAYGDAPKPFYLGCGLTFILIEEGDNINNLTVAVRSSDGKLVPDPRIKPADCYNLQTKGVDLATAVRIFEYEFKPLREIYKIE